MIELPGPKSVTNEEWSRLLELFPRLGEGYQGRSSNVLRRMMDDGLRKGGGLTVHEKRRFRAIVREASGAEGETDPFYELEWLRATHENRMLTRDSEHWRSVLWDGYYVSKDIVTSGRKDIRDEWRDIMAATRGRAVDLPGEFDYGDT
jgi:hypothetical protein